MRSAAEQGDRPFVERAADEDLRRVRAGGGGSGAHADAPLPRVSHDESLGELEHARAESALDRRRDEHPGSGEAHLPRVVELHGDGGGGLLEIGVGKDDEGRLAARAPG